VLCWLVSILVVQVMLRVVWCGVVCVWHYVPVSHLASLLLLVSRLVNSLGSVVCNTNQTKMVPSYLGVVRVKRIPVNNMAHMCMRVQTEALAYNESCW
jgi:hypothetical protein